MGRGKTETIQLEKEKPVEEEKEKIFEEAAKVEVDESYKKIQGIEDLPGIGPTSADKLLKAGYKTVESIAVASPDELVEAAEIGELTAIKAIQAARDAMKMGFESAEKILLRRAEIGKISTGSKALDELFGGGIETQGITEVYGAFSSGKSQICFQACINVQLPKEQGGLDGNVLFVDTENTFRPERLSQIALAKELNVEEALKRIFVARATNADHQIMLIEKAHDIIKEKNIKLIVVDSLMAQFRSEYLGRGMLADRQQKINKHLHQLQKIAEMYNLAILVTNQVMSRPDILFGDPTAPVGGNVVAHASLLRAYLRKSKGEKRIARLVDSPSLPEGEAIFAVTPNGIADCKS